MRLMYFLLSTDFTSILPISFSTSNFTLPSGFAFVYFEDERDAEDAIRGLDNRPFGYDRRRLSVEWARVQFRFIFPIFFRVASFYVLHHLYFVPQPIQELLTFPWL